MEYQPNNPGDPPADEGNDRLTTEADVVTEEAVELVAYLDGELSASDAAEVERRLAADQRYREHLRQLQQSWDMLDVLPRTSVNEDFTRSTVEMVTVAVEQRVEKQLGRENWAKRSRWVLTLVIAIALATTGFTAVYSRMTRDNRQLIIDLPVIERVDLYRDVDDIRFLERLAEEGLFDEEQADAP